MKKGFTMFSILFTMGIVALGGSSCHKSVNNILPADSTVVVIPPPMPADSNSKTYLALGDSYTIGQSVADSERFPAQTSAYLKAAGFNMKKPEYIATTGWTTAQLQSPINNVTTS